MLAKCLYHIWQKFFFLVLTNPKICQISAIWCACVNPCIERQLADVNLLTFLSRKISNNDIPDVRTKRVPISWSILAYHVIATSQYPAIRPNSCQPTWSRSRTNCFHGNVMRWGWGYRWSGSRWVIPKSFWMWGKSCKQIFQTVPSKLYVKNDDAS